MNDTNLALFEINSEKYSSLTKLLRVSALILRFVKKIRQQFCENGYSKSSELKDVEQKWPLHVQKKYFASELDAISNGKRNNLQVQLGIYIDENGLLRCQGRLENAGLCENVRHPILLQERDTFTHLVIEKMRKEILHSGVSQTLARVRQRFWIPHGRAAVKRFVSQKGTPTQIISDNGSQLKAANSIVDRIWRKTIGREEVQTYVSNARITWIFIVEISPWMGGFYERLVGLVKRVFRKALGRRLLTLIHLQTLVKKAGAVINSRPLVYEGDDVSSSITLTPNHFLMLNPTIGGKPKAEKDEKDTFRAKESKKRWAV
ncbi:uncharacterized protein LOC128548967 [Mercenaria mercenaria]|uniref:uncharacterized protein LOC128548967 n=1 Tax=Mercenaria mercenaria TaxID=6596 RepID=UPI00234EE322|nr:uncharacterized protein LOC128548967 [Mercenaria mercenaria]